MSKLSRMLNITLKQLKGEKITYAERFKDWFDHNKVVSTCRDWFYSIKAFLSNLPMFIKFAWGYRAWDYSYAIEILITLLETTGKNIKEHGWAKDKDKTARRAFTAAGLLRKAYMDGVPSKTHTYIYKKYGYSFSKNYKRPPKHIKNRIDKMLGIASKREMEVEQELKDQAWKYLSKYIEHMWD